MEITRNCEGEVEIKRRCESEVQKPKNVINVNESFFEKKCPFSGHTDLAEIGRFCRKTTDILTCLYTYVVGISC